MMLKSKIEVSIIVPAYNVEDYIEKCIDSILNQSYKNFELLIIDDGSSDNTADICKAYLKDKRIKLICQKNSGVSNARNKGINMAKGKYIAFIDADDELAENYIEKMLKTLEATKSEMTCCSYSKDIEEMKNNNEQENYILSSAEFISQITKNNLEECYIWNKLFIRDIIIKNNIFFEENIIIWEDMLFLLKYILKIKKISTLKSILYYYRTRENSAVNCNESIKKIECKVKVLEEIMKLSIDNENFVKLVKRKYINNLINLLFKSLKEKNLSKENYKKNLEKVKKVRKEIKPSLKNDIKYFYLCFKKFN